jgi:hypothetical protein
MTGPTPITSSSRPPTRTRGLTAQATYTLKRQSDGTTDIDYQVIRDGKNLKGRFLGVVLGTVGKGRSEGAFEKFVKAVEARNN